MAKFYLEKFLQYALVIIFTITLNFCLPRLMPGDPLKYIVGEDIVLMSVEEREQAYVEYGLDKPAVEQYLNYVGGLLEGDMGYSFRLKRPVTDVMMERLPWTLFLQGLNIVFSTILGVVFGTIAAWHRGKATDITLNNIFIFFRSMPSFWIGMILVAVFAAGLGWFPVYGAQSNWAGYEGWAKVADIAKHAVLPLITLVLLSVSQIYLTMRYSMIDVLAEDYILMAKMKGLEDEKVRYVHGMRNALVPVVTVLMLNIGYMVGGSTIIETVFAYPGMGRLLFEAVNSRDYIVIQGCILIMTLCVIVANIIADMLYPLLDPRVV